MLFLAFLALLAPADWVPARWPWTEPKTLDLVAGSPVNCLLVEWDAAAPEPVTLFAREAKAKGFLTLAVLRPQSDAVAAARRAVDSGLNGVVLEGDFSDPASVHEALAGTGAAVIELTARRLMRFDSGQPVLGTYQGVWPGIQITEDGHAKAGPTGSPWIDTNTGFIRAARSNGDFTLWMGNRPPDGAVITTRRYLQVISDAAMSGARWVVAFDAGLASGVHSGDSKALETWAAILNHLKFIESRPEWRTLSPYGQLALVQEASASGLLSGGILDMIATKHTPVRAVPPHRLDPGALAGIRMAVNVDPAGLTDAQKNTLRGFARGGGTLLTAPSGWKSASGEAITLEEEELKRLDEIWREINSMIGRTNLGARLFNVSSMISALLSDGGRSYAHIVNFSEYPVESVAVHFQGKFTKATLWTPEGGEQALEVYPAEEGAATGVDIPQVSVWATVRLD
ncbi:MAG: hypothetical protein IPM24_03040 [Bryobacterales bacterium]|nr:hypothetical protein [Bryobacterales bacterium]